MIKTWNWKALHQVNVRYNTRGKDRYYFNVSSYNGGPTFVENTQEYLDFIQNYKNIFTSTQTINEDDVIYFFKESKYPRFKFSANRKNAKTIQPDKADKLVTPNIISEVNYYTGYIIAEVPSTGISYLFNKQHSQHLTDDYKFPTIEENIEACLRDKFIVHGDDFKIYSDLKAINSSNRSTDLGSFMTTVLNNMDKCVNEESMEKYVSEDSSELDKEMYDSLNSMLSSKDGGVVELGIKMLSNFNVQKSAFRLGMLIRSNSENIANNKALQSAGFKNVLQQLNINLNYVRGSDTLQYLGTLYTQSDTLNKEMIRETTVNEMTKRMNNYFEQQNRNVSTMGISFTPTVT